jgi:hypothetical protein
MRARTFIVLALCALLLIVAPLRAATYVWPSAGGSSTASSIPTAIYGSGSDGTNATVGCGAITSTVTLTRDINCSSITISGSGIIKSAGFRIYVTGTLDYSAAGACAIQNNGNAGAAASGATPGAAGAVTGAGGTLPTASQAGQAGGSPTTGNTPQSGGVPNDFVPLIGGGSWFVVNNGPYGIGNVSRVSLPAYPTTALALNGASGVSTYASIPGSGGLGGAVAFGSGVAAAGGAGGDGGGSVWLAAATIARGANSTPGIICAKGGGGGVGGNSISGNGEGGEGGFGGGGGVVYVVAGAFTGTQNATAIDVSGGPGGANGSGSFSVGALAFGGSGGTVVVISSSGLLYAVQNISPPPGAAYNPTGSYTTSVVAGLLQTPL